MARLQQMIVVCVVSTSLSFQVPDLPVPCENLAMNVCQSKGYDHSDDSIPKVPRIFVGSDHEVGIIEDLVEEVCSLCRVGEVDTGGI